MQADNIFRLSQPVGWGDTNKRLDVASVEHLLGITGHLDPGKTDGPTGYFGTRIERSIKGFQKQNRLNVDGRINPGGETINALGRTFVQNFIGADKKGHIPLKPMQHSYPSEKSGKSRSGTKIEDTLNRTKKERAMRALERARTEMKQDSLRILEDK